MDGEGANIMAICRICGYEDTKLPDNWVNWECWRCFVESTVTCHNPLPVRMQEQIVSDIERKHKVLNKHLVQAKMDLALRKAEQ
jgi:hypothetical protein